MLFDWVQASIGHIALPKVTPEEAEQVPVNDPVMRGFQDADSEKAYLSRLVHKAIKEEAQRLSRQRSVTR